MPYLFTDLPEMPLALVRGRQVLLNTGDRRPRIYKKVSEFSLDRLLRALGERRWIGVGWAYFQRK